jgi:hypothetical protein
MSIKPCSGPDALSVVKSFMRLLRNSVPPALAEKLENSDKSSRRLSGWRGRSGLGQNSSPAPQPPTDALGAVAAEIRRKHNGQAIDVIALSLSCEYTARAALERPDDYRSLDRMLLRQWGYRRSQGQKRGSSTARQSQRRCADHSAKASWAA